MERDLVVRAQEGDLDAFAALTAGRTGRLFGAARLILRDDDLAADVVQDALLQAWVDLRGLRDPDRFDAWLHRLLVRACYRSAKRRRTREIVELRVSTGAPSIAGDAEGAVAMRDELDRGFRRLAPEQRAVLVLRYYLDLPLAEARPSWTSRWARCNRGSIGRRSRCVRHSRLTLDPRMQPSRHCHDTD